MLYISDTMNYEASAIILDENSEKICTTDSGVKILGFHMDSRPTVHAHVRALQARIREITWVLRHLKQSGFNESELATVYRTVIRPILDYCCVVYHSLLTSEQDQQVKRLQSLALKNIYGPKMKYSTMS